MSASAVSALVSLLEFQEQRQRLFPSQGSLQWYLRSHKPGLVDAGALLMHAGKWWVSPAHFDQYILSAGAKAAHSQVGA